MRIHDFFQRVSDIVFSALLLVVLSPVLLIIAILVRKNLGSPVIFKQERPGRGEKLFTLYKFRTMEGGGGAPGAVDPLLDSTRLVPFGDKLRSSSLDELPELVNVLKGDMSFVGPRPLLVQYLPLYNERERLRHEVRPGITGLAQVNGRNAISWEEKFALDVEYVQTRSFALDMRILLATVRAVFSREGISEEGQATVTPFTGSVDVAPQAGEGADATTTGGADKTALVAGDREEEDS